MSVNDHIAPGTCNGCDDGRHYDGAADRLGCVCCRTVDEWVGIRAAAESMTEPSPTSDLDEIGQRAAAALPGPWGLHASDDNDAWLIGYPCDDPQGGLVATVPDYGFATAEFIEAARTDVPALVAEVRSLRLELERTEGDLAVAVREASKTRAERDDMEQRWRSALAQFEPCHALHLREMEARERAEAARDALAADTGRLAKRLANEQIAGRELGDIVTQQQEELDALSAVIDTVARDIELLRGDIHHLVKPIIGTLRLLASPDHREGFEALFWEQLPHHIDRLYLALALMDEAATGVPAPDDHRGRHGGGLNHYPALAAGLAAPEGETLGERDQGCVENWPECHVGGYDPRCCRFPKSCSCRNGLPALPVEEQQR